MLSAAVRACAHEAVQDVLDAYRPNVVAIDTETTGFRGAVIQAAAVELDARGAHVGTLSRLIAPPPGVQWERAAERVHGITRERLAREGVDPVAFLCEFVAHVRAARAAGTRVVAHNAAFDVARLNATLRWYGVPDELASEDVFCTMHASRRGKRSFKNAELYHELTGKDSVDARLHDAAVDAEITARSFLAGRRRGWWT